MYWRGAFSLMAKIIVPHGSSHPMSAWVPASAGMTGRGWSGHVSEWTQPRGEEGRRPDRDARKRRGGPKARPGRKKEARKAEGPTGTKPRGEEGRRPDRDANKEARDARKRRGRPKARPGRKKEAWKAEGPTGTQTRGEESLLPLGEGLDEGRRRWRRSGNRGVGENFPLTQTLSLEREGLEDANK